MGITVIGNGGTVAEVDGSTFRTLRTTIRPPDHGAFGAYSFASSTGILPAALAANSEVFHFRWPDATRLCVINEVKISAVVSTTMFAAGVPVQIDMVKAAAWTVQGTGGTAVTLSGSFKKRAAMGNSLLTAGDIRVATTAGLTAGTRTTEGAAFAQVLAAGPITGALNGQIVAPGTMLFRSEVEAGQHPLVLAQNEGFVIRSVAVPATGTWMMAVQIDWTELTAY